MNRLSGRLRRWRPKCLHQAIKPQSSSRVHRISIRAIRRDRGAPCQTYLYGPEPRHRRTAHHRPPERLLPSPRWNRLRAAPLTSGDQIRRRTVNALARRFSHVILTQDWHPRGHISFASAHPGTQPYQTIQVAYRAEQTLWPIIACRALPAPTSIPHSTFPTPNSSCARAAARRSTPTRPSSKTTTPPFGRGHYLREARNSAPLPLRPRV